MTRLYREVPITSAEQARRLPDDSILIDRDASVCFERSGDDWHDPDGFGVEVCMNVGARPVALVPIEAEEEKTWPYPDGARIKHVGFGGSFDSPHTRLVTPWEDA